MVFMFENNYSKARKNSEVSEDYIWIITIKVYEL